MRTSRAFVWQSRRPAWYLGADTAARRPRCSHSVPTGAERRRPRRHENPAFAGITVSGRYWARTRLPHSGHRWTGVVNADGSRSNIPSRDQPSRPPGRFGIAWSVIAAAYTTRPATTSALSSIPSTCKGRTRLQVRPCYRCSTGLAGTARGPRRTLPLWRSGCGPCRSDTVSEMKSPTGLFGSPVYSKTSTKVTDPALMTQGRTTGDRKLLEQTPVGSRDRDRPRLLVDHGRRRLLLRPGEGERG